jgi:lauroyl/myristoyl acyltransferase
VLSRGEALLVLGDDATGPPPRRHVVPFCDGHAALPAGIVTLSRLSGAPIVPFFVLPLGPRRWRVTMESPIDPPPRDEGEAAEPAVLAELAARWTKVIRANPEQWAARFPIEWIPV